MDLQEAGAAPRIQHEDDTEPEGHVTQMKDGGEVELELGFSYETIRALMERGHHVTFADGSYAAIRRSWMRRTGSGTARRKDAKTARQPVAKEPPNKV